MGLFPFWFTRGMDTDLHLMTGFLETWDFPHRKSCIFFILCECYLDPEIFLHRFASVI